MVWLITGCSSGLGRALAECVLAEGHTVIATARNPESLEGLQGDVLRKALDVTDPAQIHEAVHAHGRLDVLVNNAGYGLLGALEELGSDQIRKVFETNFFGPVELMRTALPVFRRQRSGHIVNITAVAAFDNEMGFSAYGASKAALEAASESVAGETAPYGIKVTLVVPGPFRTDFIGRSMERARDAIEDYQRTSGKFASLLQKIDRQQPGDPAKAAQAIYKAVTSERPPRRLVLGALANQKVRRKLDAMSASLNQWAALGVSTDF